MNKIQKIELENLIKGFFKEHEDQVFQLERNADKLGYKTYSLPLMSLNELELSGMKICAIEKGVELPLDRKFNIFNKIVLRYHLYAGGGGHFKKARFPLFMDYSDVKKQLQSYLNLFLN